jgi:hypothetical protein
MNDAAKHGFTKNPECNEPEINTPIRRRSTGIIFMLTGTYQSGYTLMFNFIDQS